MVVWPQIEVARRAYKARGITYCYVHLHTQVINKYEIVIQIPKPIRSFCYLILRLVNEEEKERKKQIDQLLEWLVA